MTTTPPADPYTDVPPPDDPTLGTLADYAPDTRRLAPSPRVRDGLDHRDSDAVRAAEAAVVGLCLHPGDTPELVEEAGLTPDHFGDPRHTLIMEAVDTVRRNGVRPDPITVSAELIRDLGPEGYAARVGKTTLTDLYGEARPGTLTHYVDIVKEGWVQRGLLAAGTKIQALAYAAEGKDGQALVDAAVAAVQAVADGATFGHRAVTIADAAQSALDMIEGGQTVMPTPWIDLNKIIGGVIRRNMYVIAGASGGGKTIAGVMLALHYARKGIPVLYATPEMTKEVLVLRMISGLAKVDFAALVKGGPALTPEDWEKIAKALTIIETGGPDGGPLPILVDEAGGQSIGDIRAGVRACRGQYGDCGIVVADYLQMFDAANPNARTREQEVASIAKGLTLGIAKPLDVAVLALSQINRSPAAAGRRPGMGDLRESGAIEHYASGVYILNRPNPTDHPDLAEWIVAKNRQGPTSVDPVDDELSRGPMTHPPLLWEGRYTRVLNWYTEAA